jgi:hypothetical protein
MSDDGSVMSGKCDDRFFQSHMASVSQTSLLNNHTTTVQSYLIVFQALVCANSQQTPPECPKECVTTEHSSHITKTNIISTRSNSKSLAKSKASASDPSQQKRLRALSSPAT